MIDFLLPLLGAALAALVGVDVLLTLFHPAARSGPVVRVLSRTIWAGFRSVGGCRRQPRTRVLSLAGPAIALATPIAWLALLGAGFALIYYPSLESFHFEPGIRGPAWAEAAYYSGYVLFTLGVGDVVATETWLRLLTVVEAGAGFGIFTMAVAYVLTLYRQQAEQSALASTICNTLRDTEVDWSEADSGVREWANSFASEVAGRLDMINATQKQYPILRYFRQPAEHEALPLQMARLLDFLSRAEREGGPDWFQAFSPLLVLRRSLDDYLEESRTHFVPGIIEPYGRPERESGATRDQEREREMRRLLSYLCYPPEPQTPAD